MLVLDASVAVKWFHREADSAVAERLLDDLVSGKERAIVPDFFFLEVANALLWKGTKPQAIERSIEKLFSLPWYRTPSSKELVTAAFHVALATGLTVYDAVYVALAKEWRTEFLTADKKLARAVGKPLVRSI